MEKDLKALRGRHTQMLAHKATVEKKLATARAQLVIGGPEKLADVMALVGQPEELQAAADKLQITIEIEERAMALARHVTEH